MNFNTNYGERVNKYFGTSHYFTRNKNSTIFTNDLNPEDHPKGRHYRYYTYYNLLFFPAITCKRNALLKPFSFFGKYRSRLLNIYLLNSFAMFLRSICVLISFLISLAL